MKSLLVVLATLAAVAYVSGQTEPCCRCALFVSNYGSENMVSELPQVNITDCDSHNQCRGRCVGEFNDMTNEMDLWSTVDGETVGQGLCKYLSDRNFYFIFNKRVHAYYEMCGGPWEYAGLDSQQLLCCNLGQHE